MDVFHHCAIWAYAEALTEGKQDDSEYVRTRAYELFEQDKQSRFVGGDEDVT